MASKFKLVFSCEHASNTIPAQYASLFRKNKKILSTHRAYDIGAKKAATDLAQMLKAPLFIGKTSRLLIDLNRTLHNWAIFSPFTRTLNNDTRDHILKNYYFPHRNNVERKIHQLIKSKTKVIHLAIHSFTPVLKGKTRQTQIGLLCDPARPLERSLCLKLRKNIKAQSPLLKVHLNKPYKGVSDGFTRYLRTKFKDKTYAGIEIEINQSMANKQKIDPLIKTIGESLKNI